MDRQAPLVLALCRTSGLGNDDARDVCQEVMVSVYRGLRRYGGCRLSTWVYRIARRRIADHFRSPQRRDRPVGLADQPPLRSLTQASRQNPYRECLVRDALAALARLDEPARSILVAYHLGEAPVREIARAMHLPENTVKSHLRRARLLLRERLEDGR